MCLLHRKKPSVAAMETGRFARELEEIGSPAKQESKLGLLFPSQPAI